MIKTREFRERERNWSVCTRAGFVWFSNDKSGRLGLGSLVYRELFVRVDYRTFELLLKYSSALSETTARGWVLISESEIIDGCRSRLGDGSRVCQFLNKSMTLSAGEIVSRSRRFSTLTQELLDGGDGDMS